jgi:hypothetical protein
MLVLSCFLGFTIAYLAENTGIMETKNGGSQILNRPVDYLLVIYAKFFGSLSSRKIVNFAKSFRVIY